MLNSLRFVIAAEVSFEKVELDLLLPFASSSVPERFWRESDGEKMELLAILLLALLLLTVLLLAILLSLSRLLQRERIPVRKSQKTISPPDSNWFCEHVGFSLLRLLRLSESSSWLPNLLSSKKRGSARLLK